MITHAQVIKKSKEKKKKFADMVISGSTPEQAHSIVYPNLSLNKVDYHLGSPAVVNRILHAWKKRKITLDLASKVHYEALTSKDKRYRGTDKLKAVEMTYRGHGIKEFSKDSDGGNPKSILQIFIAQREERGLPLNVIETE